MKARETSVTRHREKLDATFMNGLRCRIQDVVAENEDESDDEDEQ